MPGTLLCEKASQALYEWMHLMTKIPNMEMFWKLIFRRFTYLYCLFCCISFVLAYLSIQPLNLTESYWFERVAQDHSYPLHTYWLAFLCYFGIPLYIGYGTYLAKLVEDTDSQSRSEIGTLILAAILLLLIVLYISLPYSPVDPDSKGRYSKFHDHSLIGLYVMNYCIMLTGIYASMTFLQKLVNNKGTRQIQSDLKP